MHDAAQILERAATWREHAELLRQYGAEAQATTLEQCAADVEEELRKRAEQPLTLAEAARVSGYSQDHLGRLVREGKIPNAGRKGSPRIARQDVPIRPGAKVASAGSNREIDREQIVRSAISEGV